MKRRFAVIGAAAVAIGTVVTMPMPSAEPAADDGSEGSFAERVSEAEALIREGSRAPARDKLAVLLALDPLEQKVETFRSTVVSLKERPGTRAWRERILTRGFPALSDDEVRVIHGFSVLSLLDREGNCDDEGPETWLYLGALNGHAPSQFQTGFLLAHGTECGWTQDRGESVHWYSQAAAQGHGEAQVNLATALFLGQGAPKDQAAAIDLLTVNATERNNPRAQYLLGVLRAGGHGIRKHQRKAIELFEAAAEQGFVPAQTSLGKILWERAITPEEWQEARQWLRAAAEQGDAEAQYRLASAYISGVSGEFWRFSEAMKWFHEAAEQGHLQAQTALGLRYWEGDIRTGSMAADYERAVEWLAKAAERGQPRAQTYLGYAYASGQGVPADRAAAVAWWRKAAAQSDSRAEEALGLAYEKGRGVPKDIVEARNWYRLAKSHGSMGAAARLEGSEFERLAREEVGAAIFAVFLGLAIATAGDSSGGGTATQTCNLSFGGANCDPIMNEVVTQQAIGF